MPVKPEEYTSKAVDRCNFINFFKATHLKTNQTWYSEHIFFLRKPKLSVKINAQPSKANSSVIIHKIVASFVNPLKVELTECTLSVEGPSIIEATAIKFR